MNQDDSSPVSPRWPAESAVPRGPRPLVGGLPWADGDASAGEQGRAPGLGGGLLGGRLPSTAGQPGQAASRRARRQRSPASLAQAARAFATDAVRGLREHAAAAMRQSPAFSVSLAAHCLLLLLLALWVIRERPVKKLALSLAFGSAAVDTRETGIDVGPPREVVEVPKETRTEIANSPKPPVEDPNATPPPVPDRPTVPAAAALPRVAPAVGMLLSGRQAGSKRALLGAAGGNDASEAAVAAALEWLKRQQSEKDGLWSLTGPYDDGGSQENRLSATAMALLAFQGAGHTTTTGEHRAIVARGWRAVLKGQEPDGSFDLGTMPYLHALYSHAQATIALCELYCLSGDERFREPAERAVAYCVAAQGPEGGWKYVPGQDGDMSVTGWYMMALKSAEMAGILVSPEVFRRIEGFVDSVAVDDGVRYGYMRPVPTKPVGGVTAAVTAEALLCRQYLGWPRNDPRLVAGVELLLSERAPGFDDEDEKDVYACYYITQVAHNMEGDLWSRWNTRLLEHVPAAQVRTGRERGSWDPALDRWGRVGGRLFVTCFCTYMLEVYYRHLPLYAAQTPPPH